MKKGAASLPLPPPPRQRASLLLSSALVASLALGCGQDPAAAGDPQAQLVAEDVKSAPAVAIDGDVQAAPPRRGLVGVLPGDFPRELPIYLPASIIDFGKKDGRRFVLLQSPDPRAGVEAWLRQAAAKAGFRVESRGGRLVLSQGKARYELSFAGQSTTEFRYEY